MSTSRVSDSANTNDAVVTKLETVFRGVFGRPDLKLTDEMSMDDFPEWDSVAHINLMFVIEQSFGLQFSGNEFAEMQNIGHLKSYISKKLASNE